MRLRASSISYTRLIGRKQAQREITVEVIGAGIRHVQAVTVHLGRRFLASPLICRTGAGADQAASGSTHPSALI